MVNWYSFLNQKGKPNLLSSEKLNDSDLIICQHLEYIKYAKFSNHIEFKKYREKVLPKNNCFFETVLENKWRKPYFDIDIALCESRRLVDIKNNDIIKEIKESILKKVEDAVIIIYSSHTSKKTSFHVVVSNYYFTNHLQGKQFYKEIIENVREEYREYIDNSVYKTVQQFRILNSHKYGKDNKKIFREDLSHNLIIPERTKIHKDGLDNFLLITSLISNTSGCKYLEGYEIKKEENKIIVHGSASGSDIEQVLNIFYSRFSATDFIYLNCLDNDGNLLLTFRRINPTFCKECQRIHENENPFLTVSGLERNIYFYCRRKEEGCVLLDTLGIPDIPDISIDNITIIKEEEEEEDIPQFGMSIIDRMKKLDSRPKKIPVRILTDIFD